MDFNVPVKIKHLAMNHYKIFSVFPSWWELLCAVSLVSGGGETAAGGGRSPIMSTKQPINPTSGARVQLIGAPKQFAAPIFNIRK